MIVTHSATGSGLGLTIVLFITQIACGDCAAVQDSGSEGARKVFNVIADFGAVCDDQQDDYAAIQKALDFAGSVGGGIVVIPEKICRTSKTLHFNYSNITLAGAGKIDFIPTPPFDLYVNDRAIQVNDSNRYVTNSPVAGPIRAGDSSFVARYTSDTASLKSGDWVVINEIDQGAGSNIVAIEWVQVDSVVGTNVMIRQPFRVNFPNARPFIAPSVSGLGFFKIEKLIENAVIARISVRVPQTSEPVPGIAVGVARNTTIDDVTVDVASGNGFFAYRSNGLQILNSQQVHARTQATEMAAVTDLIIADNVFDNGQDPPPDTSSLSLDFGTSFFKVTGNQLKHCGNICMQVVGGVHDGVIAANEFGFVSDAGLGNTDGIVAYGANSIKISGNTFMGGAGVSSTAITARNTVAYTSNIDSCSNQFGPNFIFGFAILYSPPSTPDVCNASVQAAAKVAPTAVAPGF
jgi:hypothetical protein